MTLVSKLALAVALAAPSLAPRLAHAQDMAATTTAPANTSVNPKDGVLTFSGGVDLVSAYYFRGYLQENSGFIVQPYFGVATKLVTTDDFSVGLAVSTWNSLHSEHTGADGAGPDIWYENDIYVNVPITIPTNIGDVKVTPAYYIYQYPNGSFDTIQEGLLSVGFDDTKLWKDVIPGWADFSLQPYATVAYELSDGNSSEDGYFEVGISPTYTAHINEQYKIPLTFPIALGMSYKDYFQKDNGDNDFLGYVSAGVQTSIPIPDSIIPSKYGSFAITGGAYYINLFSDSLEITNNDASNVFWGKVGFTFSY